MLCKPASVAAQGSWDHPVVIAVAARSYKTIHELNGLESPAIEGESPVGGHELSSFWHPSTAGHEKPCGNLGGPPPKAKYYLVTDSGLVP